MFIGELSMVLIGYQNLKLKVSRVGEGKQTRILLYPQGTWRNSAVLEEQQG